MNCVKRNMRSRSVSGRLLMLICIFAMCMEFFAASAVPVQAASSKKSESEYVQILDASYVLNRYSAAATPRKKSGGYYWWVACDYEWASESDVSKAVFKIKRSKTKTGAGETVYETNDLVTKKKDGLSYKRPHYEYIGVYVNDSYIVVGEFDAKKERVVYCRMTIDGKEKKTITTAKISWYHPVSASNFSYERLLGVYDNYMYYCNCVDAYKVYKVNINTGNKTYIKAIKKLKLVARDGYFDGRYMYFGSKAYDCKTCKLVKCSWYRENTHSGMTHGTDGKHYAYRFSEKGKAFAVYVVKNNKFVRVMRLTASQLGSGKINKSGVRKVTSRYIYFYTRENIDGDQYYRYYRYNRSTKKLWRMTEQKYNSLVR